MEGHVWFRRPPPRRSRVTHMHWRVYGSRGWGAGRHCSHSRPAPALRLGDGSVTEIHFPSDWEEGLLDIHDLVPQLEEALGFERLREEVGKVLVAADERNTDLGFLDGLADEEVAPLDVLELAVVFGVVSGGDGGLAAKMFEFWIVE